MNLLTNLIDSWHIARANTITIQDDGIYPMVLATGRTIVESETTIEYPNSKAVINEDKSLTIIRNGEIIGWHDVNSYWNVSTQ